MGLSNYFTTVYQQLDCLGAETSFCCCRSQQTLDHTLSHSCTASKFNSLHTSFKNKKIKQWNSKNRPFWARKNGAAGAEVCAEL